MTSNPEVTEVYKREIGNVEWRVVVFDYGERYKLISSAHGTQFEASFTREQWAEFRRMVSP